jgi:hypothetical protein
VKPCHSTPIHPRNPCGSQGLRILRITSGTLSLALLITAVAAGDARPEPAKARQNAPSAHRSLQPLRAAGPATSNLQHTGPVQFNRDIRPILSENCFACHGPDRNKRMANLRLDLRSEAVAGSAIVPGSPEKSTLVERVFAPQAGRRMPPASSHKTLTAAQKDLLRRWIAQGAKYEAHWSFITPKRPPVPIVRVVAAAGSRPGTRVRPQDLVRNPIDSFILAKLLGKRILPAPEADPRTLIRRLSLDLTGLPPAPEEVAAFVREYEAEKARRTASPPRHLTTSAYTRLVDRLLASPHYGERMAIPWLDVVRYADTVGFHGDQNQNAWAYRDYVVDSFNSNKPFDRFTIEQLAGDLLPNPTPETLTATAFNRLNMMTREGGAQPKEYLAKYAADRVRTVGMAWLGATFACAECHDHKFDPISQRDFYSLAAFFADVRQWGVYADYGYTPNPDLKGYNNDYPFPPEIRVESRYLKERITRLTARLSETVAASEAPLQRAGPSRAAFQDWRRESAAFLEAHPDGWNTPTPEARVTPAAPRARRRARPQPAKEGAPAEKDEAPEPPAFRVEPDGSVLLTEDDAVNLELNLRPGAGWVSALRVELLPHAENRRSVFRKGTDEGMVTLTAAMTPAGGKKQALSFRHAGANLAEPRYRNGSEIVGVHTGWKLSSERRAEPHVSVWLPASPLKVTDGDTLTLTFPNLPAGCVRVSVSPFVPNDADHPALAAGLREALADTAPDAAKAVLLRAYLLGTAWDPEAFARAKELEAEILECRDGMTPVLVTEAVKEPMVVRVLPRGNWQDDSGPIVEPAAPHFLPGYDERPGRRLTRMDLAKWLVSPENPLTARVFVNRLWKQFFGAGLSGQVEDLGAQGEWPTHPELLDWLAVEFRESGWDVKHVARLIVTSATYRQSSALRPELRAIDPDNRLLASQNPRRLEAELVRDNALAIAGILNRDVGGPPVKPYQPEGYYANIQFPDRPYAAETDDRQWRRGVYVHWQRTFLHPMLVNFDAPSREDCIAARTAANTPQQALTLLNDPSYVEAARAFAAILLAMPGTDAQRLDAAFQRALARPARPKERASLLAFLGRMRQEYRSRPEDAKKLLKVGIAPVADGTDPAELAAWTNVCRVTLNLQETITRY